MQKYDAVDFFKSAMDREEEWWKDYIYPAERFTQ